MDIKATTVAPLETDRIRLDTAKKPEPAGDFGKLLEDVRKTQTAAEAPADPGKVHENMIALEKANITLRMAVSVRNRVVEAYRDLMHMS